MKTLEKKKGFTLTELIIASFIALILTTVILTIFFFGRKTYDYSSYSYLVTEETYNAIEWLKRDIAQTNLSSIRVYYDDDKQMKPIGISLESAVDSKDGTFTFDNDGTAKWTGHIFYCVEPSGEKVIGDTKIKIGSLVRWELPLDKEEISTYPIATDILPWDIKQNRKESNRRIVAKEVILPGQPLNLDDKKLQSIGFRVTFVRTDPDTGKEVLSFVNPALVSDVDNEIQVKHDTEGDRKNNDKKGKDGETRENIKGKDEEAKPVMENGKVLTPDGNTELVNVELTVWQISQATGQPNAFDITFRVMPRN